MMDTLSEVVETQQESLKEDWQKQIPVLFPEHKMMKSSNASWRGK